MRYFGLGVGIAVFGVLMGIRGELDAIWLRSLVAAAAGVVLCFAVILFVRQGKSSGERGDSEQRHG